MRACSLTTGTLVSHLAHNLCRCSGGDYTSARDTTPSIYLCSTAHVASLGDLLDESGACTFEKPKISFMANQDLTCEYCTAQAGKCTLSKSDNQAEPTCYCDSRLGYQRVEHRVHTVAVETLGINGCSNSTNNICRKCQGDCDADVDCGAGLRCFQRATAHPTEFVPGCGGGYVQDYDYCYDPADKGTLDSCWSCQKCPTTPSFMGKTLEAYPEFACSTVANCPATVDAYTLQETGVCPDEPAWLGGRYETFVTNKPECEAAAEMLKRSIGLQIESTAAAVVSPDGKAVLERRRRAPSSKDPAPAWLVYPPSAGHNWLGEPAMPRTNRTTTETTTTLDSRKTKSSDKACVDCNPLPYGCFLSRKTGRLYFNAAGDKNAGRPAGGGGEWSSLCKADLHPATSTTTTTTHTTTTVATTTTFAAKNDTGSPADALQAEVGGQRDEAARANIFKSKVNITAEGKEDSLFASFNIAASKTTPTQAEIQAAWPFRGFYPDYIAMLMTFLDWDYTVTVYPTIHGP